MNQILINLISNAIKFTHNGKVEINIKKQKKYKDSITLYFEVVDSGIGISEDLKFLLFTKFYQEDTATTRKYGGTGLGLAIAKMLVELMGGEIGFESEKGIGSKFWFTIKTKITEYREEVSGIINNEAIYKSKDVSILLAEDNVINQKVTSIILNKKGFDVEIAENGQIAIDKFMCNNYDIILMDVQMPLMSGIQATKEIRRYEEENRIEKGVYIVAVTANALKEDREKCINAGMNDYVSKPFNIDSIDKVFENYNNHSYVEDAILV